MSYLKTRFSNFLLKLRKITHNISSSTCKWIPLPPLNKEWTDKEVYKYFKLTEDEIKLIKETKINGYKDLIPEKDKNKINNDKKLIEELNNIIDSDGDIEIEKKIKNQKSKKNNLIKNK